MNEIEIDMINQSDTTKMLMALVGKRVRLILITNDCEMRQEGKLKTHGLDFDGFAVEINNKRSLIFLAEDVMGIGNVSGGAIIVALRG